MRRDDLTGAANLKSAGVSSSEPTAVGNTRPAAGANSKPTLRGHVLVRVITVMVGSLIVITGANVWLLTHSIRDIYQERIDRLVRLIERSNFPLTTNVADQLAQLSGAELVVLNPANSILAYSSGISAGELGELMDSLKESKAVGSDVTANLTDDVGSGRDLRRVEWAGRSHFVAVARRNSAATSSGSAVPESTRVVILLDTEAFDRLWLQALTNPLIVAAVFLPIMAWIAIRLSRQVSRPIQEIQDRLRTLAAGDLTVSAMQPAQTAEIEELQRSLESTARSLRIREQAIRENEQMSALLQVGHGIAHNVKNAATGCRLAIDLAMNESGEVDPACLEVVRQQLASIDQYIERFLNQARESTDESARIMPRVDLRPVILGALELLQPRIAHARVQVETDTPEEPVPITADPHDLEQLVMLLVQNGIDAATQRHSTRESQPRVCIRARQEENRVVIEVHDNGPGPDPDIRDRMFAPFTSNKPEGSGLGLPEVRRIAERYNGTVRWAHEHGWTVFEVSFEKTGG